MPTINANIARAWRHAGEPDRIHYAIEHPNKTVRRLYVDKGDALYEVLERHFRFINYTGPKEKVA